MPTMDLDGQKIIELKNRIEKLEEAVGICVDHLSTPYTDEGLKKALEEAEEILNADCGE